MGIISQWRSFAWEHPAKALLLTIIPFVPLMLLGGVVNLRISVSKRLFPSFPRKRESRIR